MLIYALINRASTPKNSEPGASFGSEGVRGSSFDGDGSGNNDCSSSVTLDHNWITKLENKAHSAIDEYHKDLPVFQLPLDSLPSGIKTRTLRIRAWRQHRKDSRVFELVETVLPEVRQIEEYLRKALENMNNLKHREKYKLHSIRAVLKSACNPYVESFETETSFLRHCIDHLSSEARSLKCMIGFWEEILKQQRLESISKGLAFSLWAHLTSRGHANSDKDLTELHERLQTVRQIRNAAMQCLSHMLCTREGEIVAQRLLADCVRAIEGQFDDDCLNRVPHIEALTRIVNDPTLVSGDIANAIDQAQDIGKALLSLNQQMNETSNYIDSFILLREELVEIRARLVESIDPSGTGSLGAEDGSDGSTESAGSVDEAKDTDLRPLDLDADVSSATEESCPISYA